MKSKNWSYLAGLFDGEGCIHIENYMHKSPTVPYPYKQYNLVLSIVNIDIRLMKYLIATFGGVYYTDKRSNPNWASRMMWRPKGRQNKEEMILGILPYLIVKREQAEVALEYIRMDKKSNPTKREELALRCQALKSLGKSVETNTQVLDASQVMIESELAGDCESALMVTLDA